MPQGRREAPNDDKDKGLSPFAREIEAKWAQRRQEARAVQRGIAIVVVALVIVLAVVLGLGFNIFGRAAGVSYCRGNLRHLARGLLAYTTDYDERLPPYGSDVSALLLTYVPGELRRCPLNRDPRKPSYTVTPEIGGRSLGSITKPHDKVIAVIETEFRHYVGGEPTMAVSYLDASGGAATPADLKLP